MTYPWHMYCMAALYILAGSMHFLKPRAYLRIMPRYLPYPELLVYLSGFAEIVFGVGVCIPTTKNFSLYGIVTLLILFFTVHFYMLSGEKEGAGIPKWILVVRIPLQFLLLYWAVSYIPL